MAKKCYRCKEIKDESKFLRNRALKDGLSGECKECHKISAKEQYKKKPVKHLVRGARKRAKDNGIEFNLKEEDLVLPEYCPVFGIKLEVNSGKQKDNSPSLDRCDSSKGYTPDNVRIISWKANRLKLAMSLEELERLYIYALVNEKTGQPTCS